MEERVSNECCTREYPGLLGLLLLSRKGDRIYHQLRRCGNSLDWGRACFTMDDVSSPLQPYSLVPRLYFFLHVEPGNEASNPTLRAGGSVGSFSQGTKISN